MDQNDSNVNTYGEGKWQAQSQRSILILANLEHSQFYTQSQRLAWLQNAGTWPWIIFEIKRQDSVHPRQQMIFYSSSIKLIQ